MYWEAPHYDYIELPTSSRSHHTRFRWWQPVKDSNTPDIVYSPSVWSIDNIFIGGFEINPSFLEEDFEGNNIMIYMTVIRYIRYTLCPAPVALRTGRS